MDNQLTIKQIVEVFLKRWWLVLICTIVAGIIALLFTVFLIEPLYMSKGMLYVNNTTTKDTSSVELNDITTSQKLVSTYIEILNSDTFLNLVSQESNLNLSPEVLRSKITLSAKNQTELLEIRATDPSPEAASLIVSTILTHAPNEIARIIKGGSVEIVDTASLPTKPSSPNIKLNIVCGLLLGVVIGCILVLCIELFDTRIKSREDLSSKYELPILGVIPNLTTVPKKE